MQLICETLKAVTICAASVNLGPLEHGTAATMEKVCYHRQVVASEAPPGVVVQGQQCGTVGVYNPTLERARGTVVIWFSSVPRSPHRPARSGR